MIPTYDLYHVPVLFAPFPANARYLYKGSDYCWHCPENMLSVASAEESADCVCDAQSIPCHLDPMSFNALDRERLEFNVFSERVFFLLLTISRKTSWV